MNLSKILPNEINNNFSGKKFVIWFFAGITIVTIVRSLIHIFSPDGGAQSIASIPLDTYSDEAQRAVVFMFAFWGLSQLLIGIMYLIVVLRYKSLIPLMYIFIFIEYLGRFLIGHWKNIETLQTAPGEIGNYIFIPLSVILFIFSMKED